jgi:hypothetical protein
MNKRCCISFVWLTYLALAVLGGRPQSLPVKEELLGAWVGYERGFTFFCRLVVRGDNTGTLTLLFPGAETEVYTIAQWRLQSRSLSMTVSAANGKSETIRCSATRCDYLSMDFLLTGASNQWTRSATLVSERELLKSISECARRATNVSRTK